MVGSYAVRAAGEQYFKVHGRTDAQALVTLNGHVPFTLWAGQYVLTSLILPDFGGVPDNWEELLRREIIPLLEANWTLMAFCTASHGRTGTFLASLIALLETADETPDPIAAVRKRHCVHAVETLAQAEGIFALRGQPVPLMYQTSF